MRVHELVLCSRPRPGQTPGVVNGSALHSPEDQRVQLLGTLLACFVYVCLFIFYSFLIFLTLRSGFILPVVL